MKYTPAEKMQMEAIYNPKGMAYFEFGDLIALSNSTSGVYIKREEVRIDLTKILLVEGEKKEIINPQRLWKNSVMAEKEATGKEDTKYWIITGEDGRKAYVRDHIMKLFGNGARCRIEGYTKPVLIVKNRNIPIGYVFTFVRIEDLKDRKIAEEWSNSRSSYFFAEPGGEQKEGGV
ncbi:hypothetical protein DS742_28290 [Lacrimispora amygdalina]|uniref:Uncharacterized protein n=1 Tax=Lacrimispora amygdalina TaxID=253257 RepID=A0A3E2N3M2_9FIRM|nr:hypothetical protein [Clostridium indicum]RFZ75565.1 hypothetical protein DS742_28290 [Clostridium indicum]